MTLPFQRSFSGLFLPVCLVAALLVPDLGSGLSQGVSGQVH